MYHSFIGIDIGKEEFFVAVHGRKKVVSFPNNKEGFTQFTTQFEKELHASLTVLETTGGYEMALIRHLQSGGYDVHRANTRKVKSFIRSHGKLGKSDNIDALMLALYGLERHASLPLFVEKPDETLAKLVRRRDDLTKMLVQEKNRAKAPEQGELLESIATIIDCLQNELKNIDSKINALYQSNAELAEKRDILKEIPGVGNLVATQLLGKAPELGTVGGKQIASLAGVAPHPNESGKREGYRYTRGGRKELKAVLYPAAMAAARSHSRLGDHYQKLLSKDKKKMVALTALKRKIIVIANAKLRDYYASKAAVTT